VWGCFGLTIVPKYISDKMSGYGLGPELGIASLSVEQPTTVVITESNSPWQFYVQLIITGLDKLMEQIL